MTNAHFARPERAWANIPTLAATTDDELAALEAQPEIAITQISPSLASKQIAPAPESAEYMPLLRKCAAQYGIAIEQLLGKSNRKPIVRARWLAMMALSREGKSLPQIARTLGGKHHTTVMHGLDAAQYALRKDEKFERAWANVSGLSQVSADTPLWQEHVRMTASSQSILYNQTVLAAKLDEILRRLPA